jgi:hypothetical protein
MKSTRTELQSESRQEFGQSGFCMFPVKHHCRNGTVVEINRTWTEVTLPDGRKISGTPEHSLTQVGMAQRLGYGNDLDAMCRDHDPLHAMLCDMLHLPTSYALSQPHTELAGLEEQAVLAVQEFMRKAGGHIG